MAKERKRRQSVAMSYRTTICWVSREKAEAVRNKVMLNHSQLDI